MIQERLMGEVTHFLRHRPRYPGKESRLEPVPYLKLPFTKAGLYHISEGWYYSSKVRSVVPFGHGAVDFALPYGHPVAAPCDGYAIASYHSYPLLDRDGKVKIKNGVAQRFGIGYFVQIYNPGQDRFVQLGHLSNVADTIPFSVPKKNGAIWQATGHLLSQDEMTGGKNPMVAFVKTGETIGFVGYSGLTSAEDYLEGYKRPYVIDPNIISTWNIPHVHMDEFQRNQITGKKDWRRDPYDIYMKDGSYPTHSNSQKIGKEPLFLTDENSRPLFADS